MTDSATTQPVAQAPVWQMPRLNTGKNTPGLLTYSEGRLRFETDAGVQFDAPPAEFDKLKFAQFDMLIKAEIGGNKYRIQFVRPNGAVIYGGGGGALGAAAALGDVVLAVGATKGALDGRKVGKAFREAMEAA